MVRRILAALAVLCVIGPAHAADRDAAPVRGVLQDRVTRFNAHDVPGMMRQYAPTRDMFVFNVVPPQQYDRAELLSDYDSLYRMFSKPPVMEMLELRVTTSSGDLAYGTGILHLTGLRTDGKRTDLRMRMTSVLQRIKGKWLIVHEHISVPVNTETGQAFLTAGAPGRK